MTLQATPTHPQGVELILQVTPLLQSHLIATFFGKHSAFNSGITDSDKPSSKVLSFGEMSRTSGGMFNSKGGGYSTWGMSSYGSSSGGKASSGEAQVKLSKGLQMPSLYLQISTLEKLSLITRYTHYFCLSTEVLRNSAGNHVICPL